MECEKCKKLFERPLELYNGEWACPHCRELIALKNIKLIVTDENEETFKMAEICYLRALKTPAGDKKTYSELLSTAIDFCKSSASSGNPKAMLRLGYLYDTGYFPIDEAEAFKQAYEYYRAVWNGKINDMRGVKGDGDYSNGGIKVKKSAVRLYLNLLKHAPAKMRAHERYRYETELSAVVAEGLFDGEDDWDFTPLSAERPAKIMDILQGCLSKERAPLFGLMYVDGEQFNALGEICETGKNARKSKLLTIAEKVAVFLIDLNTGVPKAIKNERDLIVDGGEYYLYFFNSAGKHALSGRKLGAVRRALEKGDAVTDFAKVNELISIVSASKDLGDFVFSDDDILVHKSPAESVAHALGDLIKTVQKNTQRGDN